MIENLRDPGFWLVLLIGLVCLALMIHWLKTGMRVKKGGRDL